MQATLLRLEPRQEQLQRQPYRRVGRRHRDALPFGIRHERVGVVTGPDHLAPQRCSGPVVSLYPQTPALPEERLAMVWSPFPVEVDGRRVLVDKVAVSRHVDAS